MAQFVLGLSLPDCLNRLREGDWLPGWCNRMLAPVMSGSIGSGGYAEADLGRRWSDVGGRKSEAPLWREVETELRQEENGRRYRISFGCCALALVIHLLLSSSRALVLAFNLRR